MRMQIRAFAKLTGVSVRTLHYYDEIGLLTPCFVDEESGYRFYDEHSLSRMQEILLLRELDFPLKSISEMLSFSDCDKQKALSEKKKLLILKKQRLERLICALEEAEKGAQDMNINVFDNSEYAAACQEYEAEVQQKWGGTSAYQEFETKTARYRKEDWRTVSTGMESLLSSFAEALHAGVSPADPSAALLVEKLQAYITENFYSCSKDILAGLGQMYVADARFQKNIDRHGAGTAEFIRDAIEHYCRK